jgi:hypothetical protein
MVAKSTRILVVNIGYAFVRKAVYVSLLSVSTIMN